MNCVVNPKVLMRLHVGALFTQDAGDRLLATNEPNGGIAPKFFLGRTDEGSLCWLRRDVDLALAADLEALCGAEPTGLDVEPVPVRDAPFIERLSRAAPVARIWTGPAFVVPTNLSTSSSSAGVHVTPDSAAVLSPYLEAWRKDVETHAPMVAVLVGQHAVSVCASVRFTTHAHEAGVETHPEFRARGYAAQAVAAWASAVRDRGCVPLYSTSWRNVASRRLAMRLGLVQFGSDLHVT